MGGEFVQGGRAAGPAGLRTAETGEARLPAAKRRAACGLQGVKKEQPPQGLPH